MKIKSSRKTLLKGIYNQLQLAPEVVKTVFGLLNQQD